MTAMRNASKNAGELIDSLTLADEPRATGGDHAGDPRGRRGRGRTDAVAKNPRLHSNAMRSLVSVALLLATVALAAGCGSSSSAQGPTTTSTAPPPPPAATSQSPPAPPPPPAKPSRIFTKKDLARIALQPKDSPADLRYVRSESGHRTLAQLGFILPRQIRAAPLVRLPQRPRRHLRCEVGKVGPAWSPSACGC